MPTFIEFCDKDFEKKIYKVAHAKNEKKKKTVSGGVTPTSVDQSF